jgi:recombinational DNA repair ATPase RecF
MVLTVSSLRCIEHAELGIPPGLARVSAKTLLLEAVFLLGRGRSFRARNSEPIVRRGQDHLRVITRHWSFRASGAWASRRPGTERLRGSGAQRRSHDPPVRVSETRPHDSH